MLPTSIKISYNLFIVCKLHFGNSFALAHNCSCFPLVIYATCVNDVLPFGIGCIDPFVYH